jgi:hypothetical protein
MMAQRAATLRIIPRPLVEALHLTLALTAETEGQKTAQREIAAAFENAFDARRQRIIVSQSQVNLVKWSCLFVQAVCALLAIAMVHSDNRLASVITIGIFATGGGRVDLVNTLARPAVLGGDLGPARPATAGHAGGRSQSVKNRPDIRRIRRPCWPNAEGPPLPSAASQAATNGRWPAVLAILLHAFAVSRASHQIFALESPLLSS